MSAPYSRPVGPWGSLAARGDFPPWPAHNPPYKLTITRPLRIIRPYTETTPARAAHSPALTIIRPYAETTPVKSKNKRPYMEVLDSDSEEEVHSRPAKRTAGNYSSPRLSAMTTNLPRASHQTTQAKPRGKRQHAPSDMSDSEDGSATLTSKRHTRSQAAAACAPSTVTAPRCASELDPQINQQSKRSTRATIADSDDEYGSGIDLNDVPPGLDQPTFRCASSSVDMSDDTVCPKSMRELLVFSIERLLFAVRKRVGSFLPDWTAHTLAEDYLEILDADARVYLEGCIKNSQPWDIDHLLSLLPDGEDSDNGRKQNGVYLLTLLRVYRDIDKQTEFVYGGSQWGVTCDLNDRINKGHMSYTHRQDNPTKPLYKNWDALNSDPIVKSGLLLQQSREETRVKTADHIRFFETISIEYFCGFSNAQRVQMPQLIPTSLLREWAQARGLQEPDETTEYSKFFYKVIGKMHTNYSIPVFDEARVSLIDRLSKNGTVKDGFTALHTMAREVRGKNYTTLRFQGFREVHVPLSDLYKAGFSFDRPHVQLKLSLSANDFAENNFAGVPREFSCSRLADVGRILLCITFKDVQDMEVDFYVQLEATYVRQHLKNSECRIVRNAVDVQSIFDYISNLLAPCDCSNDPWRIFDDFNADEDVNKIYHDLDTVKQLLPQESSPSDAKPILGFKNLACSCKGCGRHFNHGRALLGHMDLSGLSEKFVPYPSKNPKAQQCQKAYGVDPGQEDVMRAHGVLEWIVGAKGIVRRNKPFVCAETADRKARDLGYYE
ncbi:unnamed protein product [Zymoseptoria tritici ST99CH_1A5]|uniref:Uncharacterized protein n=1 Tax=Zymoseptoria tritici ST99CH_1A5 TaxID=1276529 RepID=A0A1Y6LYV3_ZYMTR|nr:unnamed protein product [Zymoseptoria tritici ST99CH_1A5]